MKTTRTNRLRLGIGLLATTLALGLAALTVSVRTGGGVTPSRVISWQDVSHR